MSKSPTAVQLLTFEYQSRVNSITEKVASGGSDKGIKGYPGNHAYSSAHREYPEWKNRERKAVVGSAKGYHGRQA